MSVRGDYDFEVVVSLLHNKGKSVMAISNRSSLSCEMREACNYVVYLDILRKELRYRKK